MRLGSRTGRSTVNGDIDLKDGTLNALLALRGGALAGRIVNGADSSYVLSRSAVSGRDRAWSRIAGTPWLPLLPDNADWSLLASICPSELAARLQKLLPSHLVLVGISGGAIWHLRSIIRSGGTVRQEDFEVQRTSHYLVRYALTVSRGGSSSRIEVEYSQFNAPVSLTLPPMADPSARYGTAAIPLTDGRILAAGGIDIWGRTQTSLLFDPHTDSWAPTGDMHVARGWLQGSMPAVVRLVDGRALVVGGTDTGAVPEVYDPATGQWTSTGPMAVPRDGSALISLPDGHVLAAGGTDRSRHFTAAAEIFDPRSGDWTRTGDMTVPRTGGAAILLPSGKVLVAGGQGRDTENIGGRAEIYDPASGRWSAVASMPDPLGTSVHLLPQQDGAVLALGNSLWSTNLVAETYDERTDTWNWHASSRSVRTAWTPVTLPDGRVLIAGGSLFSDTDRHYHALKTALLFDPASDTWSGISSMSSPRAAASTVSLSGGRVMLFGGYRSLKANNTPATVSDILPSAEIYDPAAAGWQSIAGMETARTAHP